MLQSSRTLPPHRVPPTVVLSSALAWNRSEAYWFLLALIVAAAVWSSYPASVLYVFGIALLGATVGRFRVIRRRVGILRGGVIADVVGVDTANGGIRNARIAHATGWNVQRRWYTGEITISTVHFQVGGTPAHLFLRGLPFTSGVVIAHYRKPSDAMVISEFPCDLRLDGRGRWSAEIPRGFWRPALATMATYGSIVAGLVVSLRGL